MEQYKATLEHTSQAAVKRKITTNQREFEFEANVQALQFNEAEKLCQMALDIHRENSSTSSIKCSSR